MHYFLTKRGPYKHPGRLFIEQVGMPTCEDDIVRYTVFLREQARAGKYPPIKLSAIRWHFGITLAIEQLPSGTPGFADHVKGIIWVRRDDLETRQQFTEAHEMIELLYGACQESPQWDESIFARKLEHKERLCHKGAAALLMPREAFLQYLDNGNVSLQTASFLAESCRTSLTATVHRMVDLSPNQCAMIIWHNKASTEKETGALRIWWAESSNSMGYISPGQYVDDKSLIWKAYETGQLQTGFEYLRIGNSSGTFAVEAKRVTLGDNRCVLSLIQPLPIPSPTSPSNAAML